MLVVQGCKGSVCLILSQLIAFRYFRLFPSVLIQSTIRVLIQIRNNRAPVVFCTERYTLIRLFSIFQKNCRDRLRTDAILILSVIPDLQNACTYLARCVFIRQCGNGCFQCVFGCFCYFFLCLSQAVTLRQIFLHPGVYVLLAAGVLVKILHGTGPVVLLIQSDCSCHFRAISHQVYGQLGRTLAILILVVIPYFLHNCIYLLRLVRVGQRGDKSSDAFFR